MRIGAIAERVAHQVVGVAVGVATMAAHPAIVRQLGLENSRSPRSAAVDSGRGPRGSWSGASGSDLDNRDRVVETVGHVNQGPIRARRDGSRSTSDDDPARALVGARRDRDLVHSGQRHDQIAAGIKREISRVARRIANIAKVE